MLLNKFMGILLGTMNNIGATIVVKFARQVGFHSTHTESQCIFVFVFICSFINSSLFVTLLPQLGLGNGRHSTVLTRRWYNFFAPLILTVTITTNILPYLGVLIDLIINKCIRKK